MSCILIMCHKTPNDINVDYTFITGSSKNATNEIFYRYCFIWKYLSEEFKQLSTYLNRRDDCTSVHSAVILHTATPCSLVFNTNVFFKADILEGNFDKASEEMFSSRVGLCSIILHLILSLWEIFRLCLKEHFVFVKLVGIQFRKLLLAYAHS